MKSDIASETDIRDALQNPGLGAALALGMILITATANIIYLVISARAERWMK